MLKPEFANEFQLIVDTANQVRRVIAGIVHEDPTSREFMDEVKIQMQPGPDGSLGIIGWCARDPIEGMPDEQFNEEIEIIPRLLSVEQELARREQLMAELPVVPEQSPFKR
jgi:hypothetical protein